MHKKQLLIPKYYRLVGEKDSEIPCVIKLKGKNAFIYPSELENLSVKTVKNEIAVNFSDKGDGSVNDGTKEEIEKKYLELTGAMNPTDHSKLHDNKEKRKYNYKYYKKNNKINENKRNKKIKNLFEIVCKPYVYTDQKLWQTHKARIHEIVKSYELKLAGLKVHLYIHSFISLICSFPFF